MESKLKNRREKLLRNFLETEKYEWIREEREKILKTWFDDFTERQDRLQNLENEYTPSSERHVLARINTEAYNKRVFGVAVSIAALIFVLRGAIMEKTDDAGWVLLLFSVGFALGCLLYLRSAVLDYRATRE